MKPARDKKYLAWIRTLECIVCNRLEVEAHHTGPHGMGQKASDYTCIPLCADHHTMGADAYHRIGRKRWEEMTGRAVAEIVERLNGRWRES